MKGKVRVVCVDSDTSIEVSVQDGQQSIRWLGVIVQQRLRSTKNAFNKMAGNCFVTGLFNQDGDLLDPKQKIDDYAQWDNCMWTVTAKTCEKFPADEWGNPAYEDWAAAAYLHSDHTFSWAVEMNHWRAKIGYYQPNESQTDSQTADGSMIQIGDRPIPEVAFDLDVSAMKWAWLEMPIIGEGKNAVTLDREAEIASLKAVLAERYDLILVIFQHYCGAGEIGERYGMSTLEFSHFLRLCGVVVQGSADAYIVEPPKEQTAEAADGKDAKDSKDDDESKEEGDTVGFFEEAMKAFVENTVKTTAPSAAVAADVGTASLFESSVVAEAKTNSVSAGGSLISASADGSVAAKYSSVLLSRAHFGLALVEVAMQRMPNVTPAEATTRLLDDTVFPMWQQLCEAYSIYQEYEEDAVFRMFFHENYYILKRQFLHYSHGAIIPQSRVEEQRALQRQGPPFIDVDKLVQIFKATLYIGSALTDEEVEGEIMSAFLRVQLNPRSESQEYREAVFAEFLEMIASVGLMAVDKETSGLTEGKRLRMAFNYIIESSPGFQASNPRK